MPTEFNYVAFWAIGQIYRDGKLVNDKHLIHVMVTEVVRGDNYKLQFDGGVGNPPSGITLHLMVPPYRPGPKGMERVNVKTGFIPFPFIQKHMMETMKKVQSLPPQQRQMMMAKLKEVKELMMKTKEHVMEAMKKGEMDGQPFLHVMFGNIEMKAK